MGILKRKKKEEDPAELPDLPPLPSKFVSRVGQSSKVAPKPVQKEPAWEIIEVPTEVVYKVVNKETGEEIGSWDDVVDYLNSLEE